MRASELIEDLKQLIEQFGDYIVVHDFTADCEIVDDVRVASGNQLEFFQDRTGKKDEKFFIID